MDDDDNNNIGMGDYIEYIEMLELFWNKILNPSLGPRFLESKSNLILKQSYYKICFPLYCVY